MFCSYACPACQVAGFLRRHGSYWKYFYCEQLQILRCICRKCQVTHAIIPCFSLPGSCLGTREVEQYIDLREKGQGRVRAGKVFYSAAAMNKKHLTRLDKAFQRAVDQAKAIFSGWADDRLCGTAWIESLVGRTGEPILGLNQYCLEHGVNAICLTRFSIQRFGEKRAQNRIQHKYGSGSIFKLVIDCW